MLPRPSGKQEVAHIRTTTLSRRASNSGYPLAAGTQMSYLLNQAIKLAPPTFDYLAKEASGGQVPSVINFYSPPSRIKSSSYFAAEAILVRERTR